MSFPENIFSKIQIVGETTIGPESFYEIRIENDGNGNPLYVGYSPFPEASTSESVWALRRMYYDVNGYIERVRQPLQKGFVYSWDDRSSVFS